jgi:hypothetical protein
MASDALTDRRKLFELFTSIKVPCSTSYRLPLAPAFSGSPDVSLLTPLDPILFDAAALGIPAARITAEKKYKRRLNPHLHPACALPHPKPTLTAE